MCIYMDAVALTTYSEGEWHGCQGSAGPCWKVFHNKRDIELSTWCCGKANSTGGAVHSDPGGEGHTPTLPTFSCLHFPTADLILVTVCHQ